MKVVLPPLNNIFSLTRSYHVYSHSILVDLCINMTIIRGTVILSQYNFQCLSHRSRQTVRN